MRCCIKTLTNAALEGRLNDRANRDREFCRWCQTRMVLDGGVWQWDKTRSWYTPEAKAA